MSVALAIFVLESLGVISHAATCDVTSVMDLVIYPAMSSSVYEMVYLVSALKTIL